MATATLIKYGKNISWLLVEKIVRIVLGITIGAWMARYLGPRDFGVFNFAQSFVGIFAALSVLGLDDILMLKIINDKSKKGAVLGTVCVLKILGSGLLLLCIYLTIPFFKDQLETKTMVFIFAASFFFKSFNVIDYYFRSNVLVQYVVFSNLASSLICSILKIFLIVYEQPLIYFAIVVLFDVILCSFFYGIFYIWKEDFFRGWRFDFSMAKTLLSNSWPLFLTGVVASIDIRVDQVMLNKMIGAEATGYYAAAIKINESVFWLFAIISLTLFPAIVNAKKESVQKYTSRIENLYTFMIMVFLVSCVPLIVFAESIISILYGDQYTFSIAILQVGAASGFFIAVKTVQGSWALTENLQRYSLILQTAGTLCNIVLNFFLIKKFGIMGAAYGTLLSHAIGVIVLTGLIRPMRYSLIMMAKGILNIVTFRFVRWKSLLRPD